MKKNVSSIPFPYPAPTPREQSLFLKIKWILLQEHRMRNCKIVGGLLGGGKGYISPLQNYWGGGGWPPLPTPVLYCN